MDKSVRIGWMYPDCLNLHGERGSVQAFECVGTALGLDVQVRRIEDFDDPIPLDGLDLLFFAPGELTELGFLRPALERQRAALEAGFAAQSKYTSLFAYTVAQKYVAPTFE